MILNTKFKIALSILALSSSALGTTVLAKNLDMDQLEVQQHGKKKGWFKKVVRNAKQKKVETPANAKSLLTSSVEIKGAKGQAINVKTRDWGDKFDSLSKIFSNRSNDKNSLEEIRSKYIKEFEDAQSRKNSNYVQLSKNISKDYINWVSNIVDDIVKKSGEPPAKFTILLMGSASRKEVNLYSDLEIAFLVDKKDVATGKYFSNLFQQLSDRIYLLGEHPDTGNMGFHFDGAEHAPFRKAFFARYADPLWADKMLEDAAKTKQWFRAPYEGNRLFLATPEEFAAHIDPNHVANISSPKSRREGIAKREKAIEREFEKALKDPKNASNSKANILKEVTHYVDLFAKPYSPTEKEISDVIGSSLLRSVAYGIGDQGLYQRFKDEAQKLFKLAPKLASTHYSNRGEEIAYRWLKKTNEDFYKKVTFFKTGKVGDTIDLKRQLYRFSEQVFTNLALFYNLKTENSIDTIDALVKTKIINQPYGETLKDLVNFTLGLRIKNQILAKKAVNEVYATEAAYEKAKTSTINAINELKNKRIVLVAEKATKTTLDEIDFKSIKLQEKLKNIELSAPGKILSGRDIKLLEEKYIPILQKLQLSLNRWVRGNKKAFDITIK